MMKQLAQLGFMGAALAAISLGAACTQDQESLIIERALFIEPSMDGLSCVASGDSDTGLSLDVLDVSFDTGYASAYTVLNNLQPTTTSGNNSGVEASEMKLTDVVVELSTPANPEIASNISDQSLVRFSTPIGSASFSGQETYTTFVVIPAANIAAIREQMAAAGLESTTMIVSTTFRALRSSNSGIGDSGVVESRSFELPVNVCFNCLRSCQDLGAGGTCNETSCLDSNVGSGGVCGNAQTYATSPACCDGDTTNDFGC